MERESAPLIVWSVVWSCMLALAIMGIVGGVVQLLFFKNERLFHKSVVFLAKQMGMNKKGEDVSPSHTKERSD